MVCVLCCVCYSFSRIKQKFFERENCKLVILSVHHLRVMGDETVAIGCAKLSIVTQSCMLKHWASLVARD